MLGRGGPARRRAHLAWEVGTQPVPSDVRGPPIVPDVGVDGSHLVAAAGTTREVRR